jgi:hypothetical protein
VIHAAAKFSALLDNSHHSGATSAIVPFSKISSASLYAYSAETAGLLLL